VHVQYWFLALGFVGALLGLLAGRVRPLLLAPFALLVFVLPDVRSRSVDVYGDLPLGYLVAIATLLLALWLIDREPWALPPAAVLLAGAVLTKREGILLAGCVILAGLVAGADRLRSVWKPLGGVLLVVVATYLPWAIWLRAEGLPGNGPQGGAHFVTDLHRAWDALDVIVRNLFEYNLWLLAATGVLVAVALCLFAEMWRAAAYGAALMSALTLMSAAIVWSDASIELGDVNLISRLSGTVVLCAVALTPFLLEQASGPGMRPQLTWTDPRVRRAEVAVWVLVIVAAAIAYPAELLARGGARFPSASDCVVPVPPSGPVAVVLGYRPSYPAGMELRDRAASLGIGHAEVSPDGCGRVRVSVGGVTSRAAARAMVRRADGAGLDASVEGKPAS
jgi:hypothetical protein